MPELPRRKRFQIHLSTALVMMFVVGALMWANLSHKSIRWVEVPDDNLERKWDIDEERFLDPTIWNTYKYRAEETGWPIGIFFQITEERGKFAAWSIRPHPKSGVRLESIIINTIVALIILTGVWFVSEGLIRAACKSR